MPRRRREQGLERVLGANALFATAYGNVGSSIYYALGLVAGIALGLPGTNEVRALHFGGRDWPDDALGIPVDDAQLAGRLGESILTEVRRYTADPALAVNIVLPEKVDTGLRRLRGPRALAIKRCLLFEPHVILSSVPTGK